MAKESVPQLCRRTGVSCDYWNEYAGRPVWGFGGQSDAKQSPELNLNPLENFLLKNILKDFPQINLQR